MTAGHRLKDLSDVVELIKLLSLPVAFAQQLNPYVQEKFRELWRSVHTANKRYLALWRNKFLTTGAKTIEDVIADIRRAADLLDAMRRDGVTLDPEGATGDDYTYLVTTDPEIAKKYDMHEEDEFLNQDRQRPEEPGAADADAT